MRLAARTHHFRPLHLNAATHLIYRPLASRPWITSRKRGGSEGPGRLSHIHGSPAIAKSFKTDVRIAFLIKRPQKQTYPQIYVKSAPPLNGSTQTLKIMRPRRTPT